MVKANRIVLLSLLPDLNFIRLRAWCGWPTFVGSKPTESWQTRWVWVRLCKPSLSSVTCTKWRRTRDRSWFWRPFPPFTIGRKRWRDSPLASRSNFCTRSRTRLMSGTTWRNALKARSGLTRKWAPFTSPLTKVRWGFDQCFRYDSAHFILYLFKGISA